MIKEIVCKVCGLVCKNRNGLATHIRFKKCTDNIKDYYDKFLKKNDQEGICTQCGEKTNFKGLRDGYTIYCSSKCRANSPIYKKKLSKALKGKITSIETRKKISDARKKNHLKKFENAEVEKVISEKKEELLQESIDYIQNRNVKEKKKKYKFSDETRKKMSEKAKIRNAKPEYKAKMSKMLKKRKASPELRKKLSLAHMGQKAWNKGKTGIYTEKQLERLREAATNQVKIKCEQTGGVFPNRGSKEIDCINELKGHCQYNIIDDGYYVTGYILDGYIKEYNLAIEFDETGNHSGPLLEAKDFARQKRIENKIGCTFFRIKEVDWDNNKNMVLESFRNVLLNSNREGYRSELL